MSDLSHDTGDEEREGTPPSVEAIMAAFRGAYSRRAEQADVKETFSSTFAPKSTQFPAPVVEETIDAFRKAGHRVARRLAEEPSADGSSGEALAKEAGIDETEERTAEPATDGAAEATSSAEDLAADFRRALSERGTSPRIAPPESTASHAEASEVEGVDSERIEAEGTEVGSRTAREPSVSEGGSVPESPAGHPDRLDSSFLWVTDRPGSTSEEISIEDLSESRAQEAGAFLLQGGGELPYRLLKHIRGHSNMNVYLKPVLWRWAPGQDSPVAAHVDGTWRPGADRDTRRALRKQVATINQRVSDLREAGTREKEGGMELRVLRFVTTRDEGFAPRRTTKNENGFMYPKLTPLLAGASRSNGGELVQILSMLEGRRLLSGGVVMRQYACRNCGCAFLNYEERCPHCEAVDIDPDDLVHHFQCAFTGPLSEFKEEQGGLLCPRCDRRLEQVGGDYGKPGLVYTCRQCHGQFQDPKVQATCYRCDHTNPPERLIERELKTYEVTALGKETAICCRGNSLLTTLERESRMLDYAPFQHIVESEAARVGRYPHTTSSLLLVWVKGMAQFRKELGERGQEVVEEIANAFGNTLHTSDYLSARDESLYLFLLTETDQEEAWRVGERLEETIEAILDQHLAHPPELNSTVQPLRPGIDLDDLAEQVLSSQSRESTMVNGHRS